MRKLILFCFLPLLAFTTADWITVKLDDRVTVEFPSAPEEKDMSGNQVWSGDINNDAKAMAMVMDFGKFGMDSAMLATEMEKDEAFQQFKDGILGQIQGSTIMSEKRTKVNGRHVFEYVINMGKPDTTLTIMHNRNYFVGAKMYTLSFYEKGSKPQPDVRNKFFNSLKVK
jgi:hypothetical protein